MTTYFSRLPPDLLPSLFINLSSEDILTVMPDIKLLSGFRILSKSRDFWLTLWRRDVSSFIDVPGNIQKAYTNVFKKITSMDKGEKMCYCAAEGYDIILYPLLQNLKDYNWALVNAASEGHVSIVETMLKLGADCVSISMRQAASKHHIEVVKVLLSRGTYNNNEVLGLAANKADMELLELMLESGANDYNIAMSEAAKSGHIKIVHMMLQRGANNYNETMKAAAREGHKEIVELMLNLGANDYSYGTVCAAIGKHYDTVKLLLDRGVVDYNWVLNACKKDDKIYKLILSYKNRQN